jgi:hypothetical protein
VIQSGISTNTGEIQMNDIKYLDMAIAGGILFAAYKWGNGMMKAGAVAVAANIVANQVPYVRDALTVKFFK